MFSDTLISTVDTSLLEPSGRTLPAAPVVERARHMNWALKALLPIAVVLVNGLLLLVLVSSSLEPGPRNNVIAVAAGGAFVICAAVLVVFSFSVRRPMLELQQKIARLRLGDMDVEVSFANRNDEIGDLAATSTKWCSS